MQKNVVVIGIALFVMLAMLNTNVAGKGSSGSFYDFDSNADIPGSASSMLEYVTDSERQKAQEYIEMCHNRPRYTFFTSNNTMTKQDARLCLYEDPSDFETWDYLTYAESILLMMVPVVAVIILFIPIAIVFYICRCCTCGTYKPTRKMCGGEPMTKDWTDGVDGYKTESVVGFQVAAVLSGVVVLVGAIIVEVGNRSVTSNFDGAVTYIDNIVVNLVGLLNDSLDTVESLSDDFSDLIDTEGIVSMLEEARDVGIQLEEYDAMVQQYYPVVNKPRQIVLLVLMIIPCIAVVFLLLGAFIGFPAFTCTSIVLSCVSIPIVLILFGIHYPLGTAVADTCYFIDSATDVTSPDYVEYIGSFYRCDDTSPIGNITGILDEAVAAAVSLFCENLTQLCNMSEVPCDDDFDGEVLYSNLEESTCPLVDCSHVPKECNQFTLNDTLFGVRVFNYYLSCYNLTLNCSTNDFNITDYTNFSNYTEYDVCASMDGQCGTISALDQCSDEKVTIPDVGEVRRQYPLFCGLVGGVNESITLDECAESCAFNETQSTAKVLIRFRNAASKILDLLLNRIRPFLRCSTMVKVLYNVEDFTCVKVMNSLRPLTSGSLAVACGLIATVIVGTFGAKRFNRKYRFHFVPVVDEGDVEMEVAGHSSTKKLQQTTVEFEPAEAADEDGREDISEVEVVELEEDDDEQ